MELKVLSSKAILSTLIASLLALTGTLISTAGQPGNQMDPHELAVKRSVPESAAETTDLIGLRVMTVDAKVLQLGLENGARPVALVFLNDGCTISRRYVPRLNELALEAAAEGVDLYAVISNPAISWTTARAFREDYDLKLPLLYDANGDLARQLSPRIVPSAFVVNLAGRVTYSGRIDDRFPSLTKIRKEVRSHDLMRAIEAVAAGSSNEPVRTDAVGCVFTGWPERVEEPNYASHIAPILNANCVECHRSGGVAPFSLDSYAAAKRWSKMIVPVTRSGLMPPWRAQRGFGHFREERFLTTSQLDLLAAWAETGASFGDSAQPLPPTPRFENSTWKLGEPDLELTMSEPFDVPADGEDIYRYFVLPMEMLKDAVVVAMDFRPGDPSVVHHANFFIDYSGRGQKFDRKDPAPGFSVFGTGGFMAYDGANVLGGWAPGVAPYQLPEGRGFDLPRGGDIILEIHYHLTGKATQDQSSIAFYFAKGPVKRGVSGLLIGTQDVDIPAGEANYWRKVTMDVTADMRLVDIAPHMHYLGREARVIAHLPDRTELSLLHVTDWDLRWQGIYTFRQPVPIPAGSTLEAYFRFDNSEDNPSNPHSPPRSVRWGWESDQEMAELYLTILPKDRKAAARLDRAAKATWTRPADSRIPQSTSKARR